MSMPTTSSNLDPTRLRFDAQTGQKGYFILKMPFVKGDLVTVPKNSKMTGVSGGKESFTDSHQEVQVVLAVPHRKKPIGFGFIGFEDEDGNPVFVLATEDLLKANGWPLQYEFLPEGKV